VRTESKGVDAICKLLGMNMQHLILDSSTLVVKEGREVRMIEGVCQC
jgi:hypothetical protein